MRPQCSHITRKRGIYYYRRRLPKIAHAEVCLSLATRDFREAQYLAELLDQGFEDIVITMHGKPDLGKILTGYLRTFIEVDNAARIAAKAGQPVYAPNSDPNVDPVEADLEIIAGLLSDAKEALARRDYRSIARTVDALMQIHGVGIEYRNELAFGILNANAQGFEWSRKRVLGEPVQLDLDAPDETPRTHEVAGSQASSAGPMLSEVLPGFLEFATSVEDWRGQTLAQNRKTYSLFTDYCGNRPIAEYTKKDTGAFYDALRKLPALYGKDKLWRGLSMAEIVDKSAGAQVKRLSMKTVKRHFSALGKLFDYAKKRGLYEGENPAYQFDFPSKGADKLQRQMWSGEKLTRLFSSPVWTGCHPTFRARPGTAIIKDERYWLPILGLYHGNRLEEFAQLRREDIQQEGAILFFNITDAGDRKLKNEQSKRHVPIHPVVIKLGFLQYLDEVAPMPSDRVFPRLLPGGPDKKLGYYFTKWWTEYRKSIGLYEPGLDYHSFRHGVTTKLYGAGAGKVVVDELTAHEGEGTSQTVYLQGLPLSMLYEALCKVTWPEVAF